MATFRCTLHRLTAKNSNPSPPPVVLTLAGSTATERTESFEEFKNGAADLGETVLSLQCNITRNVGGRGYQKQEVFLAIKEAVRRRRCFAAAGGCSALCPFSLSRDAAAGFAWMRRQAGAQRRRRGLTTPVLFPFLSRREPAPIVFS